jgi:hypothetical protein
MTELQKTRKLCTNGHVMDPAWDVCPYCPSDRRASAVDPALAKTVRIDESAPPPPAPAPAPAAARRTEILNRAPAIAGVAWFVGDRAPNQGRMHRIDGERVTVGAAGECDIVIGENHVSDRHASLRFNDREFLLTDLDSTNGTFVNGQRIGQQKLADGDRIRFGSSEWVFKCVVYESA